MKKLLLILVVILTALSISACKASDPIAELETYDYYLLVVVSRQRMDRDTFVYFLEDTSTPENNGYITYETDKLWSVGEFIIAIEIDEEGNVYYTDLNTTTDMIVD